ncbi:uncharacterized protein APUU_70283A, partial [Aspergillus puulaauensis]
DFQWNRPTEDASQVGDCCDRIRIVDLLYLSTFASRQVGGQDEERKIERSASHVIQSGLAQMANDNGHPEKHESTWPEQRCIANHPELDVGQREKS